MTQLLDNIFWHALSGTQAHFSTGTDTARRFAKGFSPILGFADAQHPDFDALLPFCDVGESFYCAGWTGAMPAVWSLHAEKTMFRMVWDGVTPEPEDSLIALPLNHSHAQQAVALATLTNPGPFGLRTIELGDYLGYFEADRLVAMAGERSAAGAYREVSGVCTHPDFQGKGLARRLMHRIIRQQLSRDEIPFLHVMADNHAAHGMYLRMGFRDYCETAVRVVSRC